MQSNIIFVFVVWIFANDFVDSGDILASIQRQPCGSLTWRDNNGMCRYYNEPAAVSEGRPRVTISQNISNINMGDNVRFMCTATGEQPINSYWLNGDNIPFYSMKGREHFLEFPGISSNLVGQYICRATNVYGTTSKTLILESIIPWGSNTDKQRRKSELACDRYKGMVPSYRIIFGDPAERNEFPWMAALGYTSSQNYYDFRCGGTIISLEYVLTAAHCCTPTSPDIVQLGSNFLYGTGSTNILVESCTQHEQYSHERLTNDIALVKLQKRMDFSGSILPACLRASSSDLPSDKNLVATGWGQTEDGKISVTLKKTSLKTVELPTCQVNYLGSELRYLINTNQYCAADPNHVHDTCYGDSGGPIQIFDNSPLATVVGITSFGLGCSSPLPGVYTRVASFLDWIEDRVWS